MSYNPNNPNGQATMANSAPVVVASDQSALSVTGTFWQATQPVSGTISALQSGTWNVGLNAGSNAIGSITNTSFASTQSGSWNVGINAGTNYIGKTRLTDGTTDAEVIPLTNYNAQAVAIVDGSGNQLTSFTVTNAGTFAVQAAQSGTWNITNISGTISLPTGAATETTLSTLNGKIPSNLTVTSTRLLVDGSGVTQPVSIASSVTITGTVSANLNAGSNYIGKTRLTDGTTDAEVVPLTGYNAQAVAIVDGSGNQVTSFGGGTQYADGTAVATPTGTVALGFDGTSVQALATDSSGYLRALVTNTINTNLDGAYDISGSVLTVPTPGLVVLVNNSGNADTLKSDGTNLKVIAASNSGVDIGDVTINNAAGASAVNIQDGGNSITVDGTVAATQSGTWNVGLNAGSNAIGSITNTSFAVTQATAASLNATVVGTGTFAVQAAQSGTWNIGTLTSITNTVTISGTVTASNTTGNVASGSPDSGNPVKIGGVAQQTLPVSNPTGDRLDITVDRYGRTLTSHIDAGMQIWKAVEYTTAQTGANIWVPTAGNRFVVTQINITTGGTTAGLITIWGAPTATTTYTAGTDQAFFRGEASPSTTSRPVILVQPTVPFFSDTTNDCLKITTSTAMTIYVQVYGYEITP